MKRFACFRQPLGCITIIFAGIAVSAVALAAQGDLEQIKRGEYLAKAGDCIACHSAPGGKPFAGGLNLPTPVGTIVSTNITPSKTHGIGNYTLTQFTDALRKGMRADGQHLYPAMPYTSYALVTDKDAAALYAYFMTNVPVVDTAPPQTKLPFPFNVRASMAAWNWMFAKDKVFQPNPMRSAEWNRGAYLVNGLAHCSSCHTPRTPLMAEDVKRILGGGTVGAWYAPNITSDTASGIGTWSVAEISAYLRTGRAEGKAQAAGPMAEAIDNSLRHLSDTDLKAMAVYLKEVAPVPDKSQVRPAHDYGKAGDDLDSIRGVSLPTDLNRMTGPQLYDANCASCHQAHGQGSPDAKLPSLFHNTALGHSNANNLVMVILQGIERRQSSNELRMPGFARDLSDQQIATLANYLTRQYGNAAAVTSPEQVKLLRRGGEPSSLITLARVGIAAAALLILSGLVLLIARARRKQ